MAKYKIIKGFRFTEKGSKMHRKDSVVELSGKELEFAHYNKCILPSLEKKPV